MKKSTIYLLCLEIKGWRQIMGAFSSAREALMFLAKSEFPKKNQYCIYKLPVNSGLRHKPSMKDLLGKYIFWYLGTTQEAVAHTDKLGNPKKAYLETIRRWPDRKGKVRVKVIGRKPIK